MLLEISGEALVHRTARHALEAGLEPLVVVLGHEAERTRAALHDLSCDFALNPSFRDATSGSLHRGLERLPPDVEGAVVLLGDMVRVTAAMLRTLHATARTHASPLVASRYGEVTAPPLFIRRALFPELLACQGDHCGKLLVRRYHEKAVFLDWPASALADVDTPQDLARLASGGTIEFVDAAEEE